MVSDTGKHPSLPRRRQRLAVTIVFVCCALALAFIPVAAARPDHTDHVRPLPGPPTPDQTAAPQTGTPRTSAPQTSAPANAPAKAVVPSHSQRHGRGPKAVAEPSRRRRAPRHQTSSPNGPQASARATEAPDSGPIDPPDAGRVSPTRGRASTGLREPPRTRPGQSPTREPWEHQRDIGARGTQAPGGRRAPGRRRQRDSFPSHVPSGEAKKCKSPQAKSLRQPAVSGAAPGRPTAISTPILAASTPVLSTTTPPTATAPPTVTTPSAATTPAINASRPAVSGRSSRAARGLDTPTAPVQRGVQTPLRRREAESRPWPQSRSRPRTLCARRMRRERRMPPRRPADARRRS